MIDKATLRKRISQALELVDDRALRSVELWTRLTALPEYATAQVVMAFASMANEPDTDGLFARLAADGKVLVLPRMEGDVIVPVVMNGQMNVVKWGIREPVGPSIDPLTIDLVVVPGVAFTLDGHRLGHGKAFYDRFLPKTRAVTVGACFSEQVVDELPTEPHDVRLHHVVYA